MLHPTQHPSFLQFPSPTTLSPSSLSSTSLQVQPEMECVEAALKTSIRKEMSVKSTTQAFFDDLWSLNLPTGVASDDFFVDDLFDFSNDEGLVEEEEEKVSASSPKQATPDDDNCSHFSAKNDFCPLPATELVVPADDLASLEWLSQFVEDSNSEYSAPFPALAEKPKTEAGPEPGTAVPATDPETCFKTPVPAKARSKRTRTGVRVWSLGSPSLTESSSSSTTSSSSSSPSSPRLIYANPGTSLNLEPTDPVSSEKPAAKRLKKKPATDVAHAQPPRRCSHCGVQKTPQWRAGPLGAKTLCNACGVRFKSGRLLPEYRPACSPTFSSELHSNHHRKVLEMRKKKEIMGQAEAGVVAAAVASF